MKTASKFEEFHRLHKEMWTWMSEHPESNKADWPGWKRYDPDKGYSKARTCFACGYAKSKSLASDLKCQHCPITWSGQDPEYDDAACTGRTAEYHAWAHHLARTEYTRASEMALRIANMPWKDR